MKLVYHKRLYNVNTSKNARHQYHAFGKAWSLISPCLKAGALRLNIGKSGSDGKVVPAIMGDDPMSTLTAGAANQGARACIGYRIVKLDGRCLARFQSFPDWYKLPKNRSLAGTVIGNAVPPLLMKAVVESILKSLAC